MTDLSIVIVSYNTRELLRECLESLTLGAAGIAVETFVVDNASKDASAEMVAERFPQVRLIRNPDNRGFAAANNLGLAEATGRHVMLLNPDTVVRPGAFAELVRFMDAHPQAGYCGPRLVNADGSHQLSARRFPTWWSSAANLLGWDKKHPASRHCGDLHAAAGDRTEMPAGWLTGACLLVRRTAMQQVGVLDEGYFMYFEETDWCRRLANAGWAGWYVPSAEVLHYGGQSVGPVESDAPFFGNRPAFWVPSQRRYYRRHLGRGGHLVAVSLEVALNALLWLRHRWRKAPESRTKARRASQALHHLLRRGATA
ncbi:MAG: glycosyltransferase family 2 protein [Phycisphaerales bacterium]|nr:glycosyltransferase family 2 protein [Phycisphaerales bacterium]